MHTLKEGQELYKEGDDFTVEIMKENNEDIINYKLFFKDIEGHIQAYFVFNIASWYSLPPACNIQTTSAAGGYNFFPEDKKEIYKEHNYDATKVLPGFGVTALAYLLQFVKDNHPQVDLALIASFKENEPAVWKLITKVQKSTDLIQKVGGGNETQMATLFLK